MVRLSGAVLVTRVSWRASPERSVVSTVHHRQADKLRVTFTVGEAMADARKQSPKRKRDGGGKTGGDGEGFELSSDEQREVDEQSPVNVHVLHETIRSQGQIELERKWSALLWSSLAAGLSMGFSMLARALLQANLDDTTARYLIENFGYTIGFVIVILARQQLFTENTITAVLPLMTKPTLLGFGRLARLWALVLLGNLAGVALYAFGIGHADVMSADVRSAVVALGEEVMHNSVLQMFTKGVLAGWLIATMVWLVPAAQGAKVLIIVLVTYLIGIAGFTHIIVGSAEVLFLVFDGRLPFAAYVVDFALPTLAGNVVGGSLIFALISHAQVRSDTEEMAPAETRPSRR